MDQQTKELVGEVQFSLWSVANFKAFFGLSLVELLQAALSNGQLVSSSQLKFWKEYTAFGGLTGVWIFREFVSVSPSPSWRENNENWGKCRVNYMLNHRLRDPSFLAVLRESVVFLIFSFRKTSSEKVYDFKFLVLSMPNRFSQVLETKNSHSSVWYLEITSIAWGAHRRWRQLEDLEFLFPFCFPNPTQISQINFHLF